MTGLRGLAALWVLVFHAWALAGPAASGLPAPLAALLGAGWLGVDVFFVLSGFLLARGLAALSAPDDRVAPDWVGYAVMRAARILPAYYAQLVVLAMPAAALVVTSAVVWSPASVGEVVAHLVLWLNAWPWIPAHLGPWWSLPVEAGFYATLPLLWLAWGSKHRLVGLLLGAAVLAVAWRAGVQAMVPDIEQRIGWAEHLPGRGVQFIAGMVLAWLVSGRATGASGEEFKAGGRRWQAMYGSAAALLALAALVLLPQLGGERAYVGIVDARTWTWFWPLLTAVPVGVLVASLVVAPSSRVARCLGAAPLRALGVVSFSLYLWHYPVQWALRAALGGYVPPSWGLAGFIIASLAISLGVAALSWWAVERPALEAARRWRGRRRAKLHPP
ncbi:MAG: acyltransferase family protein [Silanimonas sp.]